MRRRGDSIGALERELAALRTTIADTEAEQARQAELAAEADAEARAAAGDPAAFAEAGRRADAHRSERTRLAYLVEDQTKQLAALERQLAYAEHEQAGMTLAGRQKRRRDASAKVGGILEQLAAALGELAKARDAVAESELEFRARVPSDVDEWEFPVESRDEPDWPELGDLLEVVEAGPRRPLARATAALERSERDRRLAESQRIAPAVKDAIELGNFAKLRQLAPETLPRALAFAEQDVEARVAKMPADSWGTRAHEQTLERRLERIRELVESEVSAA